MQRAREKANIGMPRFSIKELMLATALIAIVLTTLFAVPRIFDPYDDDPFFPRAWAWADSIGRGRMSRDLIQNHVQTGLTQAQVEALIGEAEYVVPRCDPMGFTVRAARIHVYSINSETALGSDWDHVCVHYDSNGKVVTADIQ